VSGILGFVSHQGIDRLNAAFGAMTTRGPHRRWLLLDAEYAPRWACSGSGADRPLYDASADARVDRRPYAVLGVCSHKDNHARYSIAPDMSLVAVFDGRIDNRNALIADLGWQNAQATRRSDADIVIAAFRLWGTASFSRLEGSFTLAISDRLQRSIYLVRDLSGTRPLYYSTANGLGFATSTAAVTALLALDSRLSSESAMAYLSGAPSGLQLDNVKIVPSGCWVKIPPSSQGPVEIHRHWNMPSEHTGLSMGEASEQLLTLLHRSLAQQAQGMVGFALSSGVDSSAVLAGFQQSDNGGGLPHAFTFVAEGPEIRTHWNELAIARETAASVGATHVPVHLDAADVPAAFEAIVETMDLPFVGPVAIAQRHVFTAAKAVGIDTLFGGHGPDLLFGGTGFDLTQRLRTLLLEGRWPQAQKFFKAAASANEQSHWTLFKSSLRSMNKEKSEQRVLDRFFETLLPPSLWIEEQNAAAVNIHSRFPFLTRELIDFGFALPVGLRVNDLGMGKAVLRESMTSTLLPSVLDRKGHVGFPVPVHSWLSENEKAFEYWINQAAELCFCDKSRLLRQWKNALAGDFRACYECWRWLSLVGWAQSRKVGFY
jgi:asparagine synthetase B (glutamine-hydrolysing)